MKICLSVSELERLSGLVGRPSESHPLHNSGLLSLDPVQDKTPLYSQLLQAYKWSNKVRAHTYLLLTFYMKGLTAHGMTEIHVTLRHVELVMSSRSNGAAAAQKTKGLLLVRPL